MDGGTTAVCGTGISDLTRPSSGTLGALVPLIFDFKMKCIGISQTELSETC